MIPAMNEPLSRNPKNALFVLMALALSFLILEFGTFLMLSLGKRQAVTWSTFSNWRSEAGAPAEEGRRDVDRAESMRSRTHQTIHPFLGFVADGDTHPATRDKNTSPQAIEHGFPRNRHDLFHQPEEKSFIVAVFGGSVAGNLTAFSPYPLERALSKLPALADREVKVLSLATGGYKQPQQLITLNWFLAQGAHFDLVINLDGFNEVALPLANHLPNGIYPFFPLDWHLRAGDLDPTTRLEIAKLALLRDRRSQWAARFGQFPWRYSLVASTVWKIYDRTLARQIMRAIDETQESQKAVGFHVRGPSYDRNIRDKTVEEMVDMWMRSSIQMNELCQALGIPYFHFLQPNQYLEGSKTLSGEELQNAFRAKHPYRPGVIDGYPALIARGEELKSRGVAFHDLTQIFRNRKNTLYIDTCCHLNRQGNVYLARAMAKRIETEFGSPDL